MDLIIYGALSAAILIIGAFLIFERKISFTKLAKDLNMQASGSPFGDITIKGTYQNLSIEFQFSPPDKNNQYELVLIIPNPGSYIFHMGKQLYISDLFSKAAYFSDSYMDETYKITTDKSNSVDTFFEQHDTKQIITKLDKSSFVFIEFNKKYAIFKQQLSYKTKITKDHLDHFANQLHSLLMQTLSDEEKENILLTSTMPSSPPSVTTGKKPYSIIDHDNNDPFDELPYHTETKPESKIVSLTSDSNHEKDHLPKDKANENIKNTESKKSIKNKSAKINPSDSNVQDEPADSGDTQTHAYKPEAKNFDILTKIEQLMEKKSDAATQEPAIPDRSSNPSIHKPTTIPETNSTPPPEKNKEPAKKQKKSSANRDQDLFPDTLPLELPTEQESKAISEPPEFIEPASASNMSPANFNILQELNKLKSGEHTVPEFAKQVVNYGDPVIRLLIPYLKDPELGSYIRQAFLSMGAAGLPILLGSLEDYGIAAEIRSIIQNLHPESQKALVPVMEGIHNPNLLIAGMELIALLKLQEAHDLILKLTQHTDFGVRLQAEKTLRLLKKYK